MAALALSAVTAYPVAAQCGTPEPGSPRTLCTLSSGSTLAIDASFTYGDILIVLLVLVVLALLIGRTVVEVVWSR